MSEHVLSILVKAIGAGTASKELRGVDAAVGKLGVTAHRGGAALQHFGGRMSSLAGPLGFVGLTAGAFGVAGALEQGIEKARTMALAVEKLTGVTGLSVHSASQLVAVFGRFGIEGDKVATMAGFAEKTLGKLAAGVGSVSGGVSKLTKFEKLYGISLHDNTGKAVDYATELNRVADYYNSNHTAAEKAAVAATLFGKSYVSLIPVLKLGAKGIAEVAAEADALGLTLKSAQDVTNVHDFIKAQRDAKEAIAGLEVQIGLLVMPDLTGALKTLSGFLASHKDEVKQFFADGLKVAEGLGSFITGTLVPAAKDVGTAFVGGWNLIPAPLREMIVKGAIADRTIKFLFGFSPIHVLMDLAGTAISKTLGSVLGGLIGKNIVQPVFVTNQVPGVPGAPGAGGGVGGLIKGAITFVLPIAAGVLIANAIKALAGVTDAQQQYSQTHGQFGPRSESNAPIIRALSIEDRDLKDLQRVMTGVDYHAGKTADDVAGTTVAVGQVGNKLVGIHAAVTRQGIATNGIPSALSRLHDATNGVKGKIADDVAATKGVRAAVNAKKLSVSLHTTIPVTNNVAVSGRDIVRQRTTFAQVGHVYAS